MSDIRLCLCTDAAFANAKKQGTQAGFLAGVTNDDLQMGKPAPWSLCVWKSYRLRLLLGHAEWLACDLAEAKHCDFSLATRKEVLAEFNLQAMIDCKRIYDHLQNFASPPGSVGDNRVAIDLVIVRETLAP